MVPGQTNRMYLTPEETGHFQGKCAERCGEYHSERLFNVEIVEEHEFLDEIRQLPEGLSGAELNRNPNENQDGEQNQALPVGDPDRLEEEKGHDHLRIHTRCNRVEGSTAGSSGLQGSYRRQLVDFDCP